MADTPNNISKLLTACITPAQDVENALQQLMTLRGLDNATGVQLDVLGSIVGEPRDGLDDDVYRQYIRARIAANRSSGTPNDLISVTTLVLNDTNDYIYVQSFKNAAVVVTILGDSTADAIAAILIEFLRDSTAAGVRPTLISMPDVDANTFMFATKTYTSGSTSAGVQTLPVVNTDNFPSSGTLIVDTSGSYPATAAAMHTAVGYGTWGAGWLCDDTGAAGGPLTAVFGSPSLAQAGGAPYFGCTGLLPDTDRAIAFQTTSDQLSGGDVWDVASTDDLAIAWVGYQSADPASYCGLLAKYPSTGITGWYVEVFPGGGLWFYGANSSGGASFSAAATGVIPIGAWYLGMTALDRATGKAIAGALNLSTGAFASTGLVTAVANGYSNGTNFTFGGITGVANACTSMTIAALYIAQGSGAATGIPANLSTALKSLAAAIQPNLETVSYVSRTATSFKLAAPTTKSHAATAGVKLQVQPGLGYGDGRDSAQPTLTPYSNVGTTGGRMADARE